MLSEKNMFLIQKNKDILPNHLAYFFNSDFGITKEGLENSPHETLRAREKGEGSEAFT